jgi:sarcosine oxidase subunit beta
MPDPTGFDVVVVGAGSVGIPIAWSLARQGIDVLVLDRGASPGQGSNKTAIGGIRATHSEPSKIRLCLRSLEIASSWQERYGDDIEWRRGGYSFVAYGEREERLLTGLLEQQRASGLEIDWYDADGLRRIVPDLAPGDLRGGTYAPGDGVCSPLLFGHAMVEQARREGARFRFGEPVTAIEQRNGRIHAVRTDRGRYETRWLINAAGAGAPEIGAIIGIDHPVRPESHEAGITEPVLPFLEPMIVDIARTATAANCYFFQLATGQLLFSLTPRPPVTDGDCRSTSAFLPDAAARILRLIPRCAPLRVRRTWRGLYPMTPDGSPLVGTMEPLSGYFVAIGMCGQGFMLGPGLGELIARVLTDALEEGDVETLRDLSPARPFSGDERLR